MVKTKVQDLAERIGRALGAADDAAQGHARLRARPPVLPRGRPGRRAPGTLGARKAQAEDRRAGQEAEAPDAKAAAAAEPAAARAEAAAKPSKRRRTAAEVAEVEAQLEAERQAEAAATAAFELERPTLEKLELPEPSGQPDAHDRGAGPRPLPRSAAAAGRGRSPGRAGSGAGRRNRRPVRSGSPRRRPRPPAASGPSVVHRGTVHSAPDLPPGSGRRPGPRARGVPGRCSAAAPARRARRAPPGRAAGPAAAPMARGAAPAVGPGVPADPRAVPAAPGRFAAPATPVRRRRGPSVPTPSRAGSDRKKGKKSRKNYVDQDAGAGQHPEDARRA